MEKETSAEALQKSLKEALDYRYALEESSIVAITDQKGIIKYANDNFCNISKYSREELIGQDHRIINSEYHPKQYIQDLWKTIASGKIWRGEFRNKAKDKSIYWVDTTIVPFLNNEGKPYQYVAIRKDITDRKKLEEQQALFASIVNSSDDAILSKSLDGIVTSWNYGAEKVFGYKAEEIIGKHISVLIPSHLQGEEIEIIDKIRHGDFVSHYETERIRKDGKGIYVSLTISPVKDALGNITGASKISRDISERKKAEEKIIKGNRLYAFISQINQSIVHIKEEQDLIDTACKIAIEIGLYKTAWIGLLDEKELLQIKSMQGAPAVIVELMKFSGLDYKTPMFCNTTTGLVLSKGKYEVKNDVQNDPAMESFKEIYLQHGIKATISFPLVKFGKVVGVYGFHSATENFFDEDEVKLLEEAAGDISFAMENFEKEKLHHQSALQVIQSEARLNEAQALSHISNWEIDLLTNVNTWSDEFYNICERKRDDIQPSPEAFLSMLHPDDFSFASEKISTAFAANEDGSFYARLKIKNNNIKHIYAEWKFEFDKNKNPIRLYGILQDITERKIAEVEREQMIADMIQRNRDLEQFAYIISHNLRAPTANIIGLTENLKEESLSATEQKQFLEALSISVIKLDLVIKDLNTILQVKREVNDKNELIHFSDLVDDILISIKKIIEKHHVLIQTDFSEIDELFSIKGYIHSIFYNLITNSIKYSKPTEQPIIKIKSKRENGKIILTFKDNGLGIDMKAAGEKVFGLYKRFHSHIEGKGMGLFMIKTQVESLGGKITVESEINKGTLFTIQFETK